MNHKTLIKEFQDKRYKLEAQGGFLDNQYETFRMDLIEQWLTDALIKQEKEMQQDIRSVLHMIGGTEDRKKIANYIREYMLKGEIKQ